MLKVERLSVIVWGAPTPAAPPFFVRCSGMHRVRAVGTALCCTPTRTRGRGHARDGGATHPAEGAGGEPLEFSISESACRWFSSLVLLVAASAAWVQSCSTKKDCTSSTKLLNHLKTTGWSLALIQFAITSLLLRHLTLELCPGRGVHCPLSCIELLLLAHGLEAVL
jgi:hypothetical protein